MLVTMQNAELVNKLMIVAYGDIDLVQRAIRNAAADTGKADLGDVVQYIRQHRRQRSQGESQSQRVPQVA